jgi:hypothetical protein
LYSLYRFINMIIPVINTWITISVSKQNISYLIFPNTNYFILWNHKILGPLDPVTFVWTNLNPHIQMMLHNKYCSISIADSWKDFFFFKDLLLLCPIIAPSHNHYHLKTNLNLLYPRTIHWLHLVRQFCRRRLKCEKFTDRRQVS